MKESLALYLGFGMEIFNYRTNLTDTKYLTKIFPSVKSKKKLDFPLPLLINLSIYKYLSEKLRIILSRRQVRPKNIKVFTRSLRSELLNKKAVLV